jgi:hypothetical protein
MAITMQTQDLTDYVEKTRRVTLIYYHSRANR